MELNYIVIGKRIREFRKEKKITQTALSEAVDTTPTFISYIESGVKGMSLETLVSIANTLCVSADAILADNIAAQTKSCEYDLATILNDCSQYERSVLISCLKNLKEAMRDNRYLIKKELE